MKEKENEEAGYYYWVVSALQDMIPPEDVVSSVTEVDEIEQICKVVEEVSSETPQFFTTT